MKFSIIIPTYNRVNDLCLCLDRLVHYFESDILQSLGVDLEAIVSDDAYSSDTEAHLNHYYPWAFYTQGPSRGSSGNRNHAVGKASGDWLVFADDDCLPQEGWLEAYIKNIDKANVLEGRTRVDSPRKRLDEEAPINEAGGCLWSCNFAIKKDLFDELGGFDETFAVAMEDVDLRVRIENSNNSIFFCENALVIHPWRRMKGLAFRKSHLKAIYAFWKKYPNLKPKTPWIYFLRLSLNQLLFHLLKYGWQTRAAGWGSLLRDGIFWLRVSIREFFRG